MSTGQDPTSASNAADDDFLELHYGSDDAESGTRFPQEHIGGDEEALLATNVRDDRCTVAQHVLPDSGMSIGQDPTRSSNAAEEGWGGLDFSSDDAESGTRFRQKDDAWFQEIRDAGTLNWNKSVPVHGDGKQSVSLRCTERHGLTCFCEDEIAGIVHEEHITAISRGPHGVPEEYWCVRCCSTSNCFHRLHVCSGRVRSKDCVLDIFGQVKKKGFKKEHMKILRDKENSHRKLCKHCRGSQLVTPPDTLGHSLPEQGTDQPVPGRDDPRQQVGADRSAPGQQMAISEDGRQHGIPEGEDPSVFLSIHVHGSADPQTVKDRVQQIFKILFEGYRVETMVDKDDRQNHLVINVETNLHPSTQVANEIKSNIKQIVLSEDGGINYGHKMKGRRFTDENCIAVRINKGWGIRLPFADVAEASHDNHQGSESRRPAQPSAQREAAHGPVAPGSGSVEQTHPRTRIVLRPQNHSIQRSESECKCQFVPWEKWEQGQLERLARIAWDTTQLNTSREHLGQDVSFEACMEAAVVDGPDNETRADSGAARRPRGVVKVRVHLGSNDAANDLGEADGLADYLRRVLRGKNGLEGQLDTSVFELEMVWYPDFSFFAITQERIPLLLAEFLLSAMRRGWPALEEYLYAKPSRENSLHSQFPYHILNRRRQPFSQGTDFTVQETSASGLPESLLGETANRRVFETDALVSKIYKNVPECVVSDSLVCKGFKRALTRAPIVIQSSVFGQKWSPTVTAAFEGPIDLRLFDPLDVIRSGCLSS
eukprot:3557211-Rhodomonas_salina.1